MLAILGCALEASLFPNQAQAWKAERRGGQQNHAEAPPDAGGRQDGAGHAHGHEGGAGPSPGVVVLAH